MSYGAWDAPLGESHTRLEAGFSRLHIDRDLLLAGIVRDAFTFLTITPHVSPAERHRKPRYQSGFLHACRSALKVIPRLKH